MEKVEYREVTEKKKVIVGCQCDVCKKDIDGMYFDFTTGHCDWGNDSVDSIKSFDVCSVKCARLIMEDYFKRTEYSRTQYCELSQSYFKNGEQ